MRRAGKTPGFEWLGRLEYAPWLARMQKHADLVAGDQADERVFCCEHSPVYVTGRRGVDNRTQPALPAPFVRADRGGETTFHGPGQLMFYPVVHLRRRGLGVRDYVHLLESSCIELLASLGIAAHRKCGFPGVWTHRGKIAALGLRVTRGVAFHGMALNVSVNPAWFAPIRPCGLDAGICRLADLTTESEPPALALLGQRWYDCFCDKLTDFCNVYRENGSR